jgi:hypothetical protein
MIYTKQESSKLHKSCSTLSPFQSWDLATAASTEQNGWLENYWDILRARGTAVVLTQDLRAKRSRNGSCSKYERLRRMRQICRSKLSKQHERLLINLFSRLSWAYGHFWYTVKICLFNFHEISASMTPSPSPSGFHTLLTSKPAFPSKARHSASLLCEPECIHSIAISSPLCRNGTFSSGRTMFATRSLLYPGSITSLRCFKISRQTGDAQL